MGLAMNHNFSTNRRGNLTLHNGWIDDWSEISITAVYSYYPVQIPIYTFIGIQNHSKKLFSFMCPTKKRSRKTNESYHYKATKTLQEKSVLKVSMNKALECGNESFEVFLSVFYEYNKQWLYKQRVSVTTVCVKCSHGTCSWLPKCLV